MREIDNMKKLTAIFTGLALALGIVTGIAGVELYNVIQQAKVDSMMEELRANSTGSKWAVDNVSNVDEPYMYVVTEVYGDEINGLAITNVAPDNGGVVLSYEHNNVPQVETGDIILVDYGMTFDEVTDVEVIDPFEVTTELIASMPTQIKSTDGERYFKEEDGSYTPESYYYQ